MPLFNRDKKPLELTEAGKLYVEKIQQIQHLENELSQQLNDLTSLQTGNLRVGDLTTLIPTLPPVSRILRKNGPASICC